MKLTTKSEYSILALIYIARSKSKFVTTEDICKKYKLPVKYLEQLLGLLKKRNYLRARRGAGGGYVLAKPASEITLAEIIRLMDGALAPTESVSKYFFSHTAIEKERKAFVLMKEIRDYLAYKMEKTTIRDLI